MAHLLLRRSRQADLYRSCSITWALLSLALPLRHECARRARSERRLLLLRCRRGLGPHLLHGPYLALVRTGSVGEHGQVVAGEQEFYALADVELQQLLAVGAAHAGPFLVLLAGGHDLVDRVLDLLMAVLAGDAQFH